MNIGKYKCIKQPSLNNTVFTVGKEYSIMQEYSLKYFHTYDDYGSRCTFHYEVFSKYFKKVEEKMKTEKYKCIAQPDNKGMHFTIGNSYEFELLGWTYYTYDNKRQKCAFGTAEFHYSFQKVEPNNNNKEMKYKVAITSTDATGQEDNKTLEGLDQDTLLDLVAKEDFSSILIEPIPEKKKVTVWFYAFDFLLSKGTSVFANIDKDYVLHNRNEMITRGCKVSEIFSKEVEI